MQESEEVAQELPAVQAGAAPLLALGDGMDATDEGRLTAQKRLRLLDDVPLSTKKSKVGADRLPELVMFMTRSSGQGDDVWLPKGELEGLGCLLGFQVQGARLHRRPRRRTYACNQQARRLTLMCKSQDSDADGNALRAIDDDEEGSVRQSGKWPDFWTE